MPKLSPMRGKELIKLLTNLGFVIVRQESSHVRLQHSDGRRTTIPVHSGEKVGVGLVRKILRDVGISRQNFEQLR